MRHREQVWLQGPCVHMERYWEFPGLSHLLVDLPVYVIVSPALPKCALPKCRFQSQGTCRDFPGPLAFCANFSIDSTIVGTYGDGAAGSPCPLKA